MGRQAIRTVVGALLAALLVMPPWSADLLPAPLDQLSPEPAAAQNTQTPVKGEVIRFPDPQVTVSQCTPAPTPYLPEYEKAYPLGYSTWSADTVDPHLMTPDNPPKQSSQYKHVYPRWEKVSPADPADPHGDFLMKPVTPGTSGQPRYVIPKWDVHPRDPRLCSVEVPPCPPSPLANPKNRDGTPKLDGRMNFSEDELGICEDVATNSEDPALVDRCLRLDDDGNPLRGASDPVGVLGFVNFHDDSASECKLRLPSRCPPGLYRISQDTCRGIYRRTWTCPSTHPIRRNQFGTCYRTPTFSTSLKNNHPACDGMVPRTVVPCQDYVGDDFLQDPQNLTEPCKAINDIMDLKIVLEVRDGTPLPADAAGKDTLQRQVLRDSGRDDSAWGHPTFDPLTSGDPLKSITYRRNFDDPSKPGTADPLEPIQPDSSQKLNKHWCEYDKRYLNLDCFDPSPQSPSCNWNPPADKHRAWCIMRASQTGGCNAIARTVLCRSLQIDLRKAAPNSDAAEAAHEDLRTMNCEPCPPRPLFDPDESAANTANCDNPPATSSKLLLSLPPNPAQWEAVHYARFARQGFTDSRACADWKQEMERDFQNGTIRNYDPSSYAKQGERCIDYLCPPLTSGRLDWKSSHTSGRVLTGTPVSFTVTDAPFTKVTKRYLNVNGKFWREDQWKKDPRKTKESWFGVDGVEIATSVEDIGNYMTMTPAEKSYWIFGSESTQQRLRLRDVNDLVAHDAHGTLSDALKSKVECYPHNHDPPAVSVSIRKLLPDSDADRKMICRLFGVTAIELWNYGDPDTPQCNNNANSVTDLTRAEKEKAIAQQGYAYLGSLTSAQKDIERSRRLSELTVEIECKVETDSVDCPSGWKPKSTGYYEVKATTIWNLKSLPSNISTRRRDDDKGFSIDPTRPGYDQDLHGEPLDGYHGLLATLASADPENGECLGYSRVNNEDTPRYVHGTKTTPDKTRPFVTSSVPDPYVPSGSYVKLDSNNEPKYERRLIIDGDFVWTMKADAVLGLDSIKAAAGARNKDYYKRNSNRLSGAYDLGVEADLDCLKFAIENVLELTSEDVGLKNNWSEPLPADEPAKKPLANLCPVVMDVRFDDFCGAGTSAAGYMTSEPVGIAVYETMTVSR